MSGIVRTYFRKIGHMRREDQFIRINTFLCIITTPIHMKGTYTPHMRGNRIVYCKERLVFFTFRTVIRSRFCAFIPTDLIICSRVIVCLAIIRTIITGIPQPLWKKDILRSIIGYRVNIHTICAGITSGNKRRTCSRTLWCHRPCIHKLYPFRSQSVYIGRMYLRISITTKLIRARVFKSKPKNIWPFFLLIGCFGLSSSQQQSCGA